MRPVPTSWRAAASVAIIAALTLPSCDRGEPGRGEEAAADRARDEQLLALAYPASKGVLPRSIEIHYDGGTGRSLMMLTLTGLPIHGGGAGVGGATLYLTSSYRGRERERGNAEGSVDGSIVVRTTDPGVLAYSGPPGTVTIGGAAVPLREASDDEHYISADEGDGEETVRFRFPTEHLVAAAAADGFTMSFGRVRVEIAGAAHADLREFAARLNPGR